MLTPHESEESCLCFFCFFESFSIFSRHSCHVRRRDVPQLVSGSRLIGLARRRNLTACVVVIVVCSVLTHRLCLWVVSILRFFFPAVCVSSIEHFLDLVLVLTSGTCGTIALTTPLKVVEAHVPRSD